MKKFPIKPFGKRMIVRVLKPQEKTEGGLFIPDSVKTPQLYADVCAVGEGVRELKVGDRILFARYTGHDMIVDGEQYLIMDEEDAMAIIG